MCLQRMRRDDRIKWKKVPNTAKGEGQGNIGMEKLQIRMLGGFSARARGNQIDDSENRSQKPWILLAYLICNRNRTVTQEELLRLCWEGEEKENPANALRVVLHRTRTMLEQLKIGCGMDMILRSRDGFSWNCRLPMDVDVEEFEALHKTCVLTRDREERLECCLKGINLYGGDFLGRNSGGTWGTRMAEKQRGRYVEMTLEALNILSDSGREEDAVQLARKVLGMEPHQEAVHRCLMEVLMKLGRAGEAVELYDKLRAALLGKFDRVPEEETQRVYFRAVRLCRENDIPVELRRIEKDDNRGENGVKICDFSFFRTFYVSAEFLILQCGLEVYNILFTVEGTQEKPLSCRSMGRAMEGLSQQLKADLRRGDVMTRCAENQILVMIRANGYEEACKCCERHVNLFYRNNPTITAKVRYGVWQVGENRPE